MEQLCFLNDFPGAEEGKFYKQIGNDASGNYDVFAGGNYIFLKNKKGLTIRFTGADIRSNSATPKQIEQWIRSLHQKHPNF